MAVQPVRSPEEVARLGGQVFDRCVRPKLRSEDDGKFVAVDILSGEFEVDDDDYIVLSRLRKRIPNADIWLTRAGYRAAYKIGRSQ